MALDLASLRQLPGLSHRPDFPHGLQVLLVDADAKARGEAEAQLRDNGYVVAPCSSSAEAAAHLASCADGAVDVLLVDVRCLQHKSAETSSLVSAARSASVPLVLMSDSSAPNEVMLGIKLGAVDFLEKPLSPLKLKNIWQHTVRRLIAAGAKKAGAAAAAAAGGPAAAPVAPAAGGGLLPGLLMLPEDSAGGSHGSGGESGSNASTSERAPVKMEHDGDCYMETSSFAAAEAPGAGGGAGSSVSDPMQLDTKSSKPRTHKYKAPRSSAPGNAGASSAPLAPKPAMGYPAGQMPQLPNVAGIEWGLPTNPLQISPKPPGAGCGLLGSMAPWMSPLMNPAAALFPSMMLGAAAAAVPSASGMTSVSSMPALSQAVAMPTLPAPPQQQQHSLAMPVPASIGGMASGVSLGFKRSDSAPLPGAAGLGGGSCLSPAPLSCADLLMPPPPPRLAGAALGGADRSDLFVGLGGGDGDGAERPLARPPIGLQLKKSASLLDFISQTLKHGDATISAC